MSVDAGIVSSVGQYALAYPLSSDSIELTDVREWVSRVMGTGDISSQNLSYAFVLFRLGREIKLDAILTLVSICVVCEHLSCSKIGDKPFLARFLVAGTHGWTDDSSPSPLMNEALDYAQS